MCEVPLLAGRTHCVLTRKICLACYMGDGFQLSSDFVASASCVPNKYKNLKKFPKTQNNSWHAFRRTQRSIDRFARSIWRFFGRISCFRVISLFSCFFFLVNCNKAFCLRLQITCLPNYFHKCFQLKTPCFAFCFCFFNWHSRVRWVLGVI